MEIILPENISEITLGQYIKHEELQQRELSALQFNRRKIALFTKLSYKETERMRQSDFDRTLKQIDTALNTEAEFNPLFMMHGVEFGFVPNLDKITIGEYADLTHYGVEPETLHRVMAVLFRPVVKKEKDTYSIMAYSGTEEYAEMMKDMPLNCVNGALVFFWSLASELQTATQKYLTQELLREMQPRTTSRILAGTQRLRNWLKTTYSKYLKSKSSHCMSA